MKIEKNKMIIYEEILSILEWAIRSQFGNKRFNDYYVVIK